MRHSILFVAKSRKKGWMKVDSLQDRTSGRMYAASLRILTAPTRRAEPCAGKSAN